MSKKRVLAAAFVAVAMCGIPAFAGGNVNFSLGNCSLNDSATAPVDEQTFFGGYMDFQVKDWPLSLAGGLYRSSKSDSIQGIDVEATITEVSFGAVKNWTVFDNMHPFAGAGLSMVKVEAEISDNISTEKADDTNLAAYAGEGFFWTLNHVMNLGVSGRFTHGSSANLGGADFDPAYFQVGVIAGFVWGNN